MKKKAGTFREVRWLSVPPHVLRLEGPFQPGPLLHGLPALIPLFKFKICPKIKVKKKTFNSRNSMIRISLSGNSRAL